MPREADDHCLRNPAFSEEIRCDGALRRNVQHGAQGGPPGTRVPPCPVKGRHTRR
jgi:hypothetical protein